MIEGLKRYELCGDYGAEVWMGDDDHGDWVKFEDVEKLVKALRLELERIRVESLSSMQIAEELEETDPTAYCPICNLLFRTLICPSCNHTKWDEGGGLDGRCPENAPINVPTVTTEPGMG